jgi:hypothetical protein
MLKYQRIHRKKPAMQIYGEMKPADFLAAIAATMAVFIVA